MDFEGFMGLRRMPQGYFGFAWVCGACLAALGQFQVIKIDFESIIGLRGVPERYFGYAWACGVCVAALGVI